MKQLWQRIFIYTLGLLALMQIAAFFMHRYSLGSEEVRRYAAENIRSMAAGLDGESIATAQTAAALFNRRGGRSWVITGMENGKEVVLAGNKGFNIQEVETGAGSHCWSDGELRIWGRSDGDSKIVAAHPVYLSDADATLYITYRAPRNPHIWTIFMQAIVGFSIVGGILAFWLARVVSRPLRRLRGEVLEIAGGSLEKRVEAKGPDEVRDVAVAVNHMADSLAKYIRNMRELVANISHELRSPLARMQVSMALLESRLQKNADEKTLAQLRLLEEEMEHMNKLIGDTLLSSKLDLHGAPPLDGTVAFSDLLCEMLRRQTPSMEVRGLALDVDVEPDIVLPGDETLLCNLVSNYLDNAVKYSADGGVIRVRLYRSGGEAVFEVENTHEPIADEVLENVFEPFYRGGVPTGGGVGLGLALVRQIAALHGGGVSAANAEHGVIFSLRLPLRVWRLGTSSGWLGEAALPR